MVVSKCPECGKFLSKVYATVNGFDEILKVTGQCKKHGEIEPTDWEYWDFYPEKEWPTTTEVTND